MSGTRRVVGIALVGLAAACSGSPSIEGQWSGRGPDGRAVGYAFFGDSQGSEARGDTVRDFRYRLDTRYDPPRLELAGRGWSEAGVVRFVGDYQMRVLLTASVGRAPESFTPEAPGVILLRREMR